MAQTTTRTNLREQRRRLPVERSRPERVGSASNGRPQWRCGAPSRARAMRLARSSGWLRFRTAMRRTRTTRTPRMTSDRRSSLHAGHSGGGGFEKYRRVQVSVQSVFRNIGIPVLGVFTPGRRVSGLQLLTYLLDWCARLSLHPRTKPRPVAIINCLGIHHGGDENVCQCFRLSSVKPLGATPTIS